jgi:hypothetical protein
MSHPSSDGGHPHSLNYAAPGRSSGSITKAGGALGIAAAFVGIAIFLGGCAGFDAAFKFALIPLLLSIAGLLLTIVGGTLKRIGGMEDPHIVASICLNLAGFMGALILIAVWRGIPIFAGGAT